MHRQPLSLATFCVFPLQCTVQHEDVCDRWGLRNVPIDLAPIANTACAFGFLMFVFVVSHA